MKKTYDFNGLRRSGRTTRLIKDAPPDAYFIVMHPALVEPTQKIANNLGRTDLIIKPATFFDGQFRGLKRGPIVLDHYNKLTRDQYNGYLSMLDIYYCNVTEHEETKMEHLLTYQQIGFAASYIAKARQNQVIYVSHPQDVDFYVRLANKIGRGDLIFMHEEGMEGQIDYYNDVTSDSIDKDLKVKVGSVVRLRSGGESMTVTYVSKETDKVEVSWFDGDNEISSCYLPIASLKVVNY